MTEQKDKAEWDSQEWRAIRNRLLDHWIGDPLAIQWVLDFHDVVELFDDLIDKDKEISDERVIRVLWESMVDMPRNPFFQANSHILLPLISQGIHWWLDANNLEDKGDDHSLHMSFVLRGACTGLIQVVIELVHGRNAMRKVSKDVVEFFGSETFSEYADKIRANQPKIADKEHERYLE